MKNFTKYSALASTILLTSALAAPAKAEAPSTAQLEKVPTQTSQFAAVKAEKTSQIKFEKPIVTTTPAAVAVEPVVAPVASETVTVEPDPTVPAAPVQAAPEAVPAASAPAPATPTAPAQAPAAPAPAPAPKAAPAASGKGATIAAAAYAQIGVAQDCTRLATNALAAAGIHHHGWPVSYLSLGTTVSAAEAKPGDLIYYVNGGMGLAHIAVYVGNGQAVHGGWNGGTTALFSANVGSGPVFIRV